MENVYSQVEFKAIIVLSFPSIVACLFYYFNLRYFMYKI